MGFYERGIFMETWRIMIGFQAIVTLVSLVAILLYMRKPEEEGDTL